MNNETIQRTIAGVGNGLFREVLTIFEIFFGLHLEYVCFLSVTPGYNYNQVGANCVIVILKALQSPWNNLHTSIAMTRVPLNRETVRTLK